MGTFSFSTGAKRLFLFSGGRFFTYWLRFLYVLDTFFVSTLDSDNGMLKQWSFGTPYKALKPSLGRLERFF